MIHLAVVNKSRTCEFEGMGNVVQFPNPTKLINIFG
jgi:hypothetical protein